MKKTLLSIVSICFLFVSAFAQSTKPDALVLYRQGNYKQAIEVCRGEIQVQPNNVDSYVVLCWSLLSDGQYSSAEYYAKAGLNIASSDPRLIEAMGEAKYFTNQNDDALSYFQSYAASIKDMTTTLARVYSYMGEIYIRKTKYNHADICYSMALRIVPGESAWWIRQGYAKQMAKDYTGAYSAYEQCLSISPNNREAKQALEKLANYL